MKKFLKMSAAVIGIALLAAGCGGAQSNGTPPPAGSLDIMFGNAGAVITNFSDDRARSIVIQSDNKIIVAGTIKGLLDYDFALARYNADGTLDTSFGMSGIVSTPVGTGNDNVNSMAIQSDGKIIVGGE